MLVLSLFLLKMYNISRERRISERDSPSDRKEDEEDNPVQDSCAMDIDKPHGNH